MLSNRIFISGLTAAGKTTHAQLIASKYELKFVSASSFLLKKVNIDSENIPKNFWVSDAAIQLREMRTQNLSVDHWVDQQMMKAAKDLENAVYDTWALPWLTLETGLRIHLTSSIRARWWKAIISHGPTSQMSPEFVLSGIKEKDRSTQRYFQSEYGFDIFKDYSIFDYIVDISIFIKAPTPSASLVSISKSQEIIDGIIQYHYQNSEDNTHQLMRLIKMYGKKVFLKTPIIGTK